MDRILVGLDASPRSPGVLAAAQELARRTGGKLILFRAVGMPAGVPPEAFSMSPDDLGTTLEKHAKDYLDELAKALPAGIVLEVVTAIGNPWQTICAVADQHDADLIVVGSHGYSGLDRVIGTTAAKIVNHATRSVLVVRHPERI